MGFVTDESEVVVIGAGAAGLAAGAHLAAAGMDFRVLEASSHPGGRAATDCETLGIPFDLGCHWLHDARANPFTPIAQALGFAFDAAPNGRKGRLLHLGARLASAGEADAAEAAVATAFAAVHAAGRSGCDVAARHVLPDLGPWAPLADHWLRLMSAAEPEQISTLDFSRYHDTDDNWPVLAGYGALIRAHARHVPVTCDCPVRRIDRSGARLTLETDQGMLRCRKVIVAVSTAVVAREQLRFTPALPAELAQAFADLPLGAAEKVALLFDADVFQVAPRTGLDAFDAADREQLAISALLNPGGRPAAVVHIAGAQAAALATAGADAMVEAALAALSRVFGSDLRPRLRRAQATGWSTLPFIGGAYSCAVPGAAGARAQLSRPFDGRIVFAGEALGGAAFSTAHGAHLSGIAAAEAVLNPPGGRL